MSRKASVLSSSYTICAGISLATILQNKQSYQLCSDSIETVASQRKLIITYISLNWRLSLYGTTDIFRRLTASTLWMVVPCGDKRHSIHRCYFANIYPQQGKTLP